MKAAADIIPSPNKHNELREGIQKKIDFFRKKSYTMGQES